MELYLPSSMCLYGVRKDSFTSNYYEIFLFVGISDVFGKKHYGYMLLLLSEVCRHE